MQLPAPEPAAAELSQQLSALICQQIQTGGPLRFDQFWQLAMFHPQYGYYHNGSAKFGAAGDFVTAPELGNVFGRCLAQWLGQVMQSIRAATSTPPRLLELGAGSGALAATVLAALCRSDQLPAEYCILEVSAELRQRQLATLEQRVPDLVDRVRWLDQPPPQAWTGVLFGNEVVDALPAGRFVRQDDGWQELHVTDTGQRLDWVPRAADQQRLAQLPAAETMPAGYVAETQPLLTDWVRSVTETLVTGAVLLIDYGYVASEYFHPQRSGGTAIAHYRHRAHSDLLAWPGLQDLSVSVNFSHLASALSAANWPIAGFCSQARFLLDFGLEPQLQALQTCAERARLEILKEVKLLTLPAEMGDRFAFLSAARGVSLPPLSADQRRRL